MAGKPGRSGRKRKADSLKIADGTYRADRSGDPDSKPKPLGKPTKPEFEGQEASDFWDKYVVELIDLGVATSLDAPRLQHLCEVWALLRRATVAVDEDPLEKMARIAYAEYSRQFGTLASEFGLNPASRSKIEIERSKPAGIQGRKRG